MTPDATPPISERLGVPLDHSEYTLDELNTKLRREPDAVVDALVWTREQWKGFLPHHNEGDLSGYDPNIWYSDAILPLFRATVNIDTETGIYDPDEDGLDAEYAGLVAAALEYYDEYYQPPRKGPDDGSPPRSDA